MSIEWLPWGTDAFARARDERKPVLLSITATWCRGCRDMDMTTYTDTTVMAIVNEHFIPVRVDADERPDISERYSLGGWPTTAFLTADGEVAGGATYVPADRMPIVLQQVAAAFAKRHDELARERVRDDLAPPPMVLSDDDLLEQVFGRFDPEYGGFGIEPKFPHAAPVRLALDRYRTTGDERMRDIAVKTLDAMGWSGVYDDVDGGFFRYAATRTWQLPHHEKLLSVNAAMLSLYVYAADVLQLARFGERAQDILRYAQTWLADLDEGGWFASQHADAAYYGASADERPSRSAPSIDERLFADVNAAMVSAAFDAARLTNDPGLRQFAIKSLERVVLGCYRPGAGVAHRVGQSAVRGLLEDQIAMATAHLDAFDLTENIVYEMMAEELAHYVVRTMWDESAGGFFDRVQDGNGSDVGLLSRRMKPFVANCHAARMLRRLAASSGEHEFASYADATSAAMARVAPSQGALAAHYLLAVQAV